MSNFSNIPISHYKVLSLPLKPEVNSVYYVLDQNNNIVKGFITDKNGVAIPLFNNNSPVGNVQSVTGTGVTGTFTDPKINISTFVSNQLGNLVHLSTFDGKLQVNQITSPDSSITITPTSTELQLQLSSAIASIINSALQPGDNISELVNDTGYVTLLDLSTVAETGDYDDLINKPSTKDKFNTELTDGDFLFVGDVTQYTDEQAQDAVGNILTDTATVDFTYDDTANTISANVKPNSITATQLADNINISEFVNNVGYELTSNKGIPNGYPSLDSGGKVPVDQLPNSVMEYKGLYDASTNTPFLADGVGNAGDVYKTTVAGAGVNNLNFKVNDYAIYNGTTWEKSKGGADDVNSVFGRAGAVVAQNGDYTASQITNVPSGNISSITVQAALNELDSEKAIDANVIHKTLDETKNGRLTVNNAVGTASLTGINTTGIGVRGVSDSASGISGTSSLASGVSGTSTSSYGVVGNGTAINFAGVYGNSVNGFGILASSTSGIGFRVNNTTGNTSDLAQFGIGGSTVAKINNLGNITGTSFIKSGAPSTNILLAGGTDIPQSTFVPSTRTININGVTQDLSTNRDWQTGYADTGVLTFEGLAPNSSTTIDIGACKGWIIDNETNPLVPVKVFIDYAGEINKVVPDVATAIGSYVLLNASGINFITTQPTPAERKANIYLGKIGHPSGVITVVANTPDNILSPLGQVRALYNALDFINEGVAVTPNGINLNINSTAGYITGSGINFVTDNTMPNRLTVPPQVPASFIYRTQTGNGGGFVTTIDPTNYDSGGIITPIGGGANSSTIQYVFYAPGAGIFIQYGQFVYNSITEGIAAIGKENFVTYSNFVDNTILIGAIVLVKSATDLSDTTKARFVNADKFGQIGGASAGISTSTLQSAYNNSLVPQITTSSALGALTIRRGSASNLDNVFVVQNGAGVGHFNVRGGGELAIKTPGVGYSLDVRGASNSVSHIQAHFGFGEGMMSVGASNAGQFQIYGGRDINGNFATTNGVRVSGINGRISLSTVSGVTAGTPFNAIERVLVTEVGNVIINNNILSDTGHKFQVTGNGIFTSDLTANSFIKSGATATNILLAGGTDIPQSTFAPSSGSGSYIQNQNASAQSANMWISGNGDFNGNITSFGTATIGKGQTTLLASFGDPSTVGNKYITIGRQAALTDIVNIQGVDAGIGTTSIALNASGGNVGIGTANPVDKLQVLGKIRFAVNQNANDNGYYGTLESTNASDTGVLSFVGAGGAGKVIGGENYGTDTVIFSNATEKIRILNNGNVGIGTTSPMSSSKLQVNGVITSMYQTANDIIGRIAATATEVQISSSYDVNGSYTPLSFYTSDTKRMTILANGNVGIGGNPAYGKLELVNPSFGTQTFAFSTPDGSANPRAFIQHITSGSSQRVNFTSTFSSGIGVANWTFENGNVGIGTTSPDSKVTIENNTATLKLRVATEPDAYWTTINTLYQANSFKLINRSAGSTRELLGRYGDNFIGLMGDVGNGRVGINTATDNGVDALQVNGSGYFGTSVKSFDFRTTTSGFITYDADNSGTGTLSIRSGGLGGASVAYFAANGNVGIGATNPSAKLEVAGTFKSGRIYDTGGEVQFPSPDTNSYGFLNATNTELNIGNFKPGVSFQPVKILGNSGNPTATFLETGNVGIGTVSPISKLSVKGTFSVFKPENEFAGLNINWHPTKNVAIIDTYNFSNGARYSISLQPEVGGNVLIGTTSDNTVGKLQVDGGATFNGGVSLITSISDTIYGSGTITTGFDNEDGGLEFFTNDIYQMGISGSTGHLCVGYQSDNGLDRLQVNGSGLFNGYVKSTQFMLSELNVDMSSTSTGTPGEIKISENYIYVCTATNTWKRAALSSF